MGLTGVKAFGKPRRGIYIPIFFVPLHLIMGRLLAIDYGKKRSGIAVSDPLRIIANPLDTVATTELIAFVQKYCSENHVDGIVVGLPMNLNGKPSESMSSLTPTINRLSKVIAPIPVVYFDERFTSVLAHRAMLDGGMKKSDRRDKAVVDRISASILLNDFMQSSSAGQLPSTSK